MLAANEPHRWQRLVPASRGRHRGVGLLGFHTPRLTAMAPNMGLQSGTAYDLRTQKRDGTKWDFSTYFAMLQRYSWWVTYEQRLVSTSILMVGNKSGLQLRIA